ncbi:4F2 cell-surface antigen heavy chain-like [Sinocyclocheilus rhinocerous]|uniref:4F2 cell-surface antigen heavy chain-like n=1 Tax=Sinocyclocheilus rhinocerous TaxID=307959 RepID=A0A673I2M0_9TELE|nr:PREDICTED: 4F2 cell-surface antigen heavy chain-like [Sinocyclocheilus rhinocerous]
MSNDSEVDMKDVELNEVEQEKQPMTEGKAGNNYAISPASEKNGIVKVKIPDEESKFTGLSKEELMKVAGTPGWVKVRWALLILFWLGWLGMLAGAIAIIIQAPRCKPLPEMNWWNYGPLYQIGDVNSFTKSSDLKGLAEKVQAMDELKVKGLIIGPIHVSSADEPEELKLTEISKEAGNLIQFQELIKAAHKRGISVVLDLTPNYKGKEPWFADAVSTVVKLESALMHWLGEGVDGFLFYGVEKASTAAPSLWEDVEVLIHNQTESVEKKKKVLIGVTEQTSPDDVIAVLNKTGVDLLLTDALRSTSALDVAHTVDRLYSTYGQTRLAWNIGGRIAGHLASLVGFTKVKLSYLLLLTLPGTPVFNYGDEIGLQDEVTKNPTMVWEDSQENLTVSKMDETTTFRKFFKSVSEKRSKERSLQHGEYLPLFNSTSAMAYVRSWDQNERYLIALNWHSEETVTLQLKHAEIPEHATVVFSTSDGKQVDEVLNLAQLEVKPEQGIMLKFPYTP